MLRNIIMLMRHLSLFALWSCCCWLGLSAQCVLDPVTGSWQNLRGGPCTNSIPTSLPLLLISPDARGSGLADIGSGTSPDAFSMFFNTAKLASSVQKLELAASYSPWIRRGIRSISPFNLVLSGYSKIGINQAVAFSMQSFSFGRISRIDSLNKTITSRIIERAYSLGYACSLSRHFSLGMNIKYIHSDLSAFAIGSSVDVSPVRSFAVDFSGSYQRRISKNNEIVAGLTLSNIGPKISYSTQTSDYLPANFRLGFGYTRIYAEDKRWLFLAEINKLMVPTPQHEFIDNDPKNGINDYREQSVMRSILRSWYDAPDGFSEELREIQWAVATELTLKNISGRLGFKHQHRLKGAISFLSLGIGYQVHRMKFDLSYLISAGVTQQNSPLLDRIYRVTLTYQGASQEP